MWCARWTSQPRWIWSGCARSWTELVERSAAVVRRYCGTEEYTGDGVMALFGAPIALEDHAFRACVAALAIQEETDRLAADVQRRDGVDLRVRVGLNSGRVIAGELLRLHALLARAGGDAATYAHFRDRY